MRFAVRLFGLLGWYEVGVKIFFERKTFGAKEKSSAFSGDENSLSEH